VLFLEVNMMVLSDLCEEMSFADLVKASTSQLNGLFAFVELTCCCTCLHAVDAVSSHCGPPCIMEQTIGGCLCLCVSII